MHGADKLEESMQTRLLEDHTFLAKPHRVMERVFTDKADIDPLLANHRSIHTARLLELEDGRKLAFAEYGDPTGRPLIYFHNHASSRLEGYFFHQDAKRAGFRIIAVDRPGIGLSDANRQNSHQQVATDITVLADSLKLRHFSLLSWAGGAPFAFALAHACPERVNLLVAISPLPLQKQPKHPGFSLSTFVNRLSLEVMRRFIGFRHQLSTRDPADYLRRLGEELSFADRKVLTNPRIFKALEQSIIECLRQGGSHMAKDNQLCFAPWSVPLTEIRVPVQLWHGAADTVVPAHCSESLSQQLNDCALRKVAKRGHYFFMQGAQDIFRQIDLKLRGNCLLVKESANEAGVQTNVFARQY